MKVLVINCGSSSLKYQVLDMTNENLLCKGLVERIGMDGSVIGHEKIGQEKIKNEVPMKDHKDAIAQVLAAIQDPEHGVIKSMDELGAVGHRVVHAGEKYASSVLITEDVIKALEECVELAPLHNPPNLLGIAACKELMPTTPMVGVFDTAFHQTMPPEAYIYALLREMKAASAIEKRTVDTVFIGGGTPSVPECGIMEKLLQGIRLGRIGTFEDVASAIAYLGSDDASWTTGEVLDVNGGLQY